MNELMDACEIDWLADEGLLICLLSDWLVGCAWAHSHLD